MSREALELLVGIALVNRRFRVLLLRRPQEILSGFDLDPQEHEMILRIHEETLDDFVAELWTTVMKEG